MHKSDHTVLHVYMHNESHAYTHTVLQSHMLCVVYACLHASKVNPCMHTYIHTVL